MPACSCASCAAVRTTVSDGPVVAATPPNPDLPSDPAAALCSELRRALACASGGCCLPYAPSPIPCRSCAVKARCAGGDGDGSSGPDRPPAKNSGGSCFSANRGGMAGLAAAGYAACWEPGCAVAGTAKPSPSGAESPSEGDPYGEAPCAGVSAAAEEGARCRSASNADGRWWLAAKCDEGGGEGEGVGDSL